MGDPTASSQSQTTRPARRALNLGLKVSLLIVLPMLLVLVLSTAFSYSQQRKRSLASMSLLASQTGRVIEHALQSDMLASDFARIQQTFDEIGQDHRIKTLYLLDTSGRVVFAPGGVGVGKRLDYQDETCQPCHSLPPEERPSGIVVKSEAGQPLFRSMTPIHNQPECFQCHDPAQRLNGLLLTDLSIEPVESALAADLRSNLAWWVGTVIITGVAANFAVHRWVLSRLRGLTEAMQQVGGRGLTRRLPETPRDEIGSLSSSFNAMTEEIRRREKENRALSDALRERAEERGELLERLLMAQEEERRRVARELHDDLGLALTSTALTIEVAEREIAANPETARSQLERARNLIAETSDQMHDLIMGLRPSALDDLGLLPAVRAHLQRTLDPEGMTFSLQEDGFAGRLAAPLETAIFRIIQEAVTNILRHARASHVSVEFKRQENSIEILIRDDGVGFDPEAQRTREARAGGLGLIGMRERAAQVGGEVRIKSRQGAGTEIRVRIPAFEVLHG